jgi:hypothetical protein
MPPEGSSEITTSIGGRCKVREGFSRPVLISREAWPVILLGRSAVFPRLISIVEYFGVAMAEGSHLFPFRTEKLSPPAPMVLPGRPGGRVGRRPINLHRRRPRCSRTGAVLHWGAGMERRPAAGLSRRWPSRFGAVRGGAVDGHPPGGVRP